MNKILFILSWLMVLSCRKEVNLKLEDARPLPVFYSYISPTDSFIRLKLMYSSPIYNSNQNYVMAAVPDADVKISSTLGTAQLIFNPFSEYYELESSLYPILPGQIYKITVTTINGDVATAETEVPATIVPINTINVESVSGEYEISDRIKVSFTDEPGRANQYRFAARYASVNNAQTDTITSDTFINELYSDVGNDGANITLVGMHYYGFYYDTTYSVDLYDVYLFNCSPSYYNFHKSIRNYTGDDPFSEPSLIYTNVHGGLGCFGAYTSSVQRYYK